MSWILRAFAINHNKLTPCTTALLKKLTGVHPSKNSLKFIKWKCSLQCKQQPAICRVSSQVSLDHFCMVPLSITVPSTPRSSKCSLFFRFSDQNCAHVASLTCALHAQPVSPNFIFFALVIYSQSRSQWLRGLRLGSAAACLLGLQVRIPPGAWMCVSCECYVLSDRSSRGVLPIVKPR